MQPYLKVLNHLDGPLQGSDYLTMATTERKMAHADVMCLRRGHLVRNDFRRFVRQCQNTLGAKTEPTLQQRTYVFDLELSTQEKLPLRLLESSLIAVPEA